MGIYVKDGDRLDPMEEQPFAYEDHLQALVAAHPELLDGKLISPENPRRWALVSREQGIAASLGESDSWAVDHLFVDQDAVPTLVEAKLGANTEVRRKVVGQMLDYAAHAVQTWSADKLRETFERTCDDEDRDPAAVLAELLAEDDEPDEDAFWDEVATNLAAKRIRLLFVADAIPEPLERVVGFLNEQMPNIEVLAVEIKQFTSASSRMLVPRVIGRIAAPEGKSAPRKRTKITPDEFMAQLQTDDVRSAADRLFTVAKEHGGIVAYGDRSVSVRIRLKQEVWQTPVTVAWVFLPSASGFSGLRGFAFGSGALGWGTDFDGILAEYVRQFDDGAIATTPVGEPGDAWAHIVSHDDVVKHVDLLADRLGNVLDRLREL